MAAHTPESIGLRPALGTESVTAAGLTMEFSVHRSEHGDYLWGCSEDPPALTWGDDWPDLRAMLHEVVRILADEPAP